MHDKSTPMSKTKTEKREPPPGVDPRRARAKRIGAILDKLYPDPHPPCTIEIPFRCSSL
jgi:hypothetical protein